MKMIIIMNLIDQMVLLSLFLYESNEFKGLLNSSLLAFLQYQILNML